ncbi:putative cellular morphogenesis protein (Bud22) [Penicillium brasilianum]|uniref:Putative cellular morphogenesis protein (Bud22) n=1 Tax=Penicillium brasilianum TaxID=104259 RepID=A0A1S9RIR3_PENBI|nr:putative cellular morphogenesis protein (Bud22) [Penicillium brasilianum]
MPKRKLSEFNGPSRLDTRKLSIKAVRLTTIFEQGVQILAKGLKTARGFERQKLSRREKTAKADGNAATLARLAEEVDALKAIDYPKTAERYLFKQLAKTKRIAESPTFKEFQEAKNVSTEGPKSAAESNVHGRLFKSTPVKNVMPEIMNGIRKLLGVEDAPAGKTDKAGAKKDAPKKEKSTSKQADVSGSEDEEAAPKKPRKSSKDNAEELESADGQDLSVSGDEDIDSDDLAHFDARLAPGSDSDDESGSDDDIENAHKQDLGDDISDSISRSPSPDFSAEDSPPSKKVKAAKGSKEPAQSTTFLPSLMMGGYWSGSEEATDDEGAAGPPKRKNRMGQQARRALWEKKYGAKANHVQEEQRKQKWSRDSGWDTRKGATGGDRDRRGGDRVGRGGFGAGRSQNRYDDRSGAGHSHANKPRNPPQDTGPLHPSWEAKRKLKEQASTATFQGKKVVFD